ncbi:sulfatase-like hydrolase/transferase [Flammeovirga sp. SubArs3]|uniref:sulfatase-like hydrolase/transferase n=1 Tax=Flammeovirga sp. SubArs3 TaxID=2995316 RepID=UPI00248C0B08|nr:sulfatase-like hydrolase/transferase [Flammeovirga sp. SubArs3]
MKKGIVQLLGILLCISSSLCAQERPNILLVMAEDISNDLACYGMSEVKTPTFDQLAKEGIRYTNCIGTNSICSPSRSALMLGTHQNITNTHNHRSNRKVVLPNEYTPITKLLADAGYKTIVGSKLVMKKGEKIDCNFMHQSTGEYNGSTDFGLFNEKSAVLKNDGKPFFAQVQLKVTHRGNWWNSIREKSQHPVDPSKVTLPPFIADTPATRLDWATYLDQIEYADHEMKMLMDQLEENGVAQNTVIIFMGDNGRANIRGKGYVYDSGLRIPLIIHYPKALKKDKVDDQLCSFTDISATILELAQVDVPTYFSGTSLFDKQERDYVYSARDIWDEVKDRSRAITTKRFKYIKNYMPEVPYDAHQGYLEYNRPAVHVMRKLYSEGQLTSAQAYFFSPKKEAEELYDLKNDPDELVNLIHDPKYKKELEKLRRYMNQWQLEHIDRGFEDVAPEGFRGVAFVKYLKGYHPELWSQLEEGKLLDLTKEQSDFSKNHYKKKTK